MRDQRVEGQPHLGLAAVEKDSEDGHFGLD
jgi:hypothetical protein